MAWSKTLVCATCIVLLLITFALHTSGVDARESNRNGANRTGRRVASSKKNRNARNRRASRSSHHLSETEHFDWTDDERASEIEQLEKQEDQLNADESPAPVRSVSNNRRVQSRFDDDDAEENTRVVVRRPNTSRRATCGRSRKNNRRSAAFEQIRRRVKNLTRRRPQLREDDLDNEEDDDDLDDEEDDEEETVPRRIRRVRRRNPRHPRPPRFPRGPQRGRRFPRAPRRKHFRRRVPKRRGGKRFRTSTQDNTQILDLEDTKGPIVEEIVIEEKCSRPAPFQQPFSEEPAERSRKCDARVESVRNRYVNRIHRMRREKKQMQRKIQRERSLRNRDHDRVLGYQFENEMRRKMNNRKKQFKRPKKFFKRPKKIFKKQKKVFKKQKKSYKKQKRVRPGQKKTLDDIAGPLPTDRIVPPTPPSNKPTHKCTSWGEPHYTTFGGKMFNFYATGDFVLARTPDRKFEVHTRLSKWHSASVNTGVAVKVNGEDVFEYDANLDGYFFKGQRFVPKFGERRPIPGGGTIHFASPTKFTVSAFNRAALLVQIVRGTNFPDGNRGFVNLELVTPTDMTINGLCNEEKLVGNGLFRTFQKPAGNTVHNEFNNPTEERKAVQFCNRKFPNAPKMRQGCIADFKQTQNPRMAVAITQSVAKFRDVRKKFQEKHGVGSKRSAPKH